MIVADKYTDDLRMVHQAIVSRVETYPFEDILNLLRQQANNTRYHIFVRHKKFFPDKALHEYDGYIILPHYSFSCAQGDFVRHTETTNISHLIDELNTPQWSTIALENVLVFFEDAHLQSYFWRVAKLIAAHFHTTLYEDILQAAARRYRHLFQKTLGEDEIPTLEQLFQFILQEFEVDATFYRETGKAILNRTFSQNVTEDNAIKEAAEPAVNYSITTKRKSQGVVETKNLKVYYLTVPVRGLLSKQSELLGAILLVCRKRISPLCEHFLADAIGESFLKRQVISKSQLITALASKIANYGSKRCSEWSVNRRISEFRNFANALVEGLHHATNAHSCTIRQYDQQTGSLWLVASSEDIGATYDTKIQRKTAPGSKRRIRVEAPFRSINSFCFSIAKPGEYVYVRNISEIDADLRDSGLADAFKTRSKTVSEFAISLYWENLRIGVMNLEADFESAFELDDTFIRTMAFLVGQAWASVHGSADRYWLSQISFTHLATHELADFRRSLEPRHQNRLDTIVETLSAMDYQKGRSTSSLFEVILFAQAQAIGLDPTCNPRDIILIDPDVSRKIALDAPFSASLKVIFDSIIRNAHKHSHLKHDKITVDVVDMPGDGKKEIWINYESRMTPADPDEARYFFYKPLRDSDGVHFGTFLVGAHVRLLGGHIAVHRDCLKSTGYGPLQFSIRIPFER